MQQLISATPILKVSNLEASIRYFTRALGFANDGVYPAGTDSDAFYAYLSRDDVRLHLERGVEISGMAVYFVVADVDALHDELRDAGAHVLYDPDLPVEGPGNQPWGMREIWVRDLDGNVLRFGQRIDARPPDEASAG